MKNRIPIFRKILSPLLLLTIAQILILVFTLFAQGLLETLNQNEKDVLLSRVEARKNYLEGFMVNDWMQLDDTVSGIVEATEAYMSAQRITAEQLDDSSQTVGPLLIDITDQLIRMLRANRVTGAYVIFNTEYLPPQDPVPNKPGVYIRDTDPTSLVSDQNEDLFLKISSKEVLSSHSIPTDSEWDIYFRFDGENRKFADVLRIPYNTAYDSAGRFSWSDMGHWNIAQDNDRYAEPILTYAVPLVLHDGTVVGVIGIDITFKYLEILLPHAELGFDNNGSYILARYDGEADAYYSVFGNGNTTGMALCDEAGLRIGEEHYACTKSLHLYESNTPFSSDEWVVAGVVGTQYMQSFSRKLILAVFVAIVIALLVGVLVSLSISYRLQKPIAQIANEIASADPRKNLKLTPTGIKEVDAMSDEIMKLSADVLESGQKLSKIIEMSSIHMSGFQVNRLAKTVFLTDGFFRVFGDYDTTVVGMTEKEFVRIMHRYEDAVIKSNPDKGIFIMHLKIENEFRYIRLSVNEAGDYCYGLAEDVTKEMLEKHMLQYERDHDSLTGLYNRRALRAKMEEVFRLSADEIKNAALVMIDLDNLKYFNDTFGHECGDQYIICAAESIARVMPTSAICARISGDEFNVLLYGYSDKAEIAGKIEVLQRAVNEGTIVLPDGTTQFVHATGGVAYYPEHSRSIEGLSKFADYAMYIAKRNHKRTFEKFDPEMFRSQDIKLRNSDALTKMLRYSLVHYALQPIVDVRTGKIFAYEALMRPDVDSFFTVADVMETARRDGKLAQIEELTMFKALETFDDYMTRGDLPPDTYLFINSIANQCISVEKGELFVQKYGKYAKQLVLELTEEDKFDKEIWSLKERQHRIRGGKVALDDYGSGYNSEITLLALSPDYIKVDMAIIRDIHLDNNKQQIVDNIVRYAHERGKFIIAEGVELEAEVKKLIELDVDYMQGFFFGKPWPAPQTVPEEALKILGI